ncbi:MAG: arylsulfotransferase family protein [Pseudomonadota bacterium]
MRLLLTFVPAIVVFAFLAGVAYGYKQFWPIPDLRTVWQEVKAVYRGEQASLLVPNVVKRQPFKGEGLVASSPNEVSAGATVIQGLDSDGGVMRLVAEDGTLLHSWNALFFDYWPEGAVLSPQEMQPERETALHQHGFHIHPDGSVLIIFSHLGAVLVDRCSEVIWRLDELVHHAVTVDEAGGYWMPAHRQLGEIDVSFLRRDDAGALVERLEAGVRDRIGDVILRVDREGRVTERLDPMEAFADAEITGLIGLGYWWDPLDPLHINEVVPVTAPLADRIDGVEAGDLLLSVRNMNMLAIIGRDGALKWHRTGPWFGQHDPDITEQGLIEVFDNGFLEVPRFGARGSSVLELDPTTGAVARATPKGDAKLFETQWMGAHQRLPNANRLIVESMGGRVLEVTPDNRVVWEYHLRWDEEFAGTVTAAERVAPGFFDEPPETWACP